MYIKKNGIREKSDAILFVCSLKPLTFVLTKRKG